MASTPRLSNFIAIVGQASGVYAILAGVSAILGWALDIRALTDWTDEGISMFPNTAICAVLAGSALLVYRLANRHGTVVVTRTLAGAMMIVAVLTLLEHATGIDLGIDTLLFYRPWDIAAAAAPMRMGLPASAANLLLGLGIVLATYGPRARAVATVLALVTAAIAALSLTGYWFGANQLFGIARLTGIALITSTVIAALSAGLMAAIPERGLVALLSRDDAGGSLFRHLALPILIVPLLLGWLRLLGEQAGLYDSAFGTAMRSLSEVVLFLALLWWTANRIGWYATSAQKAHGRLAAIVESSDVAIISKSLDGTIETWNAGAQRTFGYTAAEAIGKHVTMLIPHERINEEDEIISRLKLGQRIEHYETIRVRKDGVRIHVSLDVSPIRHADGRIIGASKIARDITESVRLKEQLRAIIEATPECIKIVAPDGSLEFMNHGGLSMIEAQSEAAVRGMSVYGLVNPEHRAEWIENHKRVCAGERLKWQYEIVGLKGTRRWMETHAVPLALPDGRTAQLAVTREITARIEMERERADLLESERTARAEAERASRLKDEFLATLSHELRTPLNAIYGWAQLLSVSAEPADLETGLDAILRNSRAQSQLIDDLLDMSRIISGKVRLDVQSTYPAAIVEAAMESVAPSATAKGIRITTVLDPNAGPVWGDAIRLQQVVWNLLSNAIKFTPKGGKVSVAVERINSHVEITVHDTGIGIARENLGVVFERFRQADSSTTRAYGGLGLGLSIVKQLVELHGGTVVAHSDGEGQGATFIVSLPISPIQDDERRNSLQSATRSEFDADAVDLSGIKVLVVDDAPDARALIRRVLVQCGAEVRDTGSAADGLSQLRVFRPHVLVSDIGMPEIDGYQFIRNVRSLHADEGGTVPAIALTAFARSEDRMRAMVAGYQVHLAKPIVARELAVTVHALSKRPSTAAGSGTNSPPM